MFFTILVSLLLAKVGICATANNVIASKHWYNDGTEYKIICPMNGAITEISYRAGEAVDQIGFTCTSSIGKTTFGPYVGGGGSSGTLTCPQGQYISSFFGKRGATLYRLGVRCRNQNDLDSLGQSGGEFGGTEGTNFDDLSYSIGSRPTSVVVHAGSRINAIQITYGNILNSGLCSNCNSGYFNSFVCPEDGVITGINFRSGNGLDSIQFTCSSVRGQSIMGPFGGSGGNGPFEDACPPGSYIGSIHGRGGANVDQFGIRCVRYGQSGSSSKRSPHGGTGGSPSDDEDFAINGKRPVEIRVWAGSIVDAIQIKYGNLPVAINCNVTSIEVIDQNIVAQPDGYEIIGVASGSTCSSTQQSISLQSTLPATESVEVDTTDGSHFNWATTVSVNLTTGISLFGAKPNISVGLSQTFRGSNSWLYTKSILPSTSSSSSQGTTIRYQGPGACLVVGYMNKYKIVRDNVPVLYRFQCEAGALALQLGTITLASKLFGKADFLDYHFRFKNIAKCTQKARACVADIKVNNVIYKPAAIRSKFYKCFPPNSGKRTRR